MIDQSTGLFAIKACVSDPDESLLTGISVKVTMDTYSQDDALLIPYDAVYYDDSQPYVYVAVDNIAERRDIETGIFDEETITVLSGLSAEDQLITSWSANLRAGSEISVQAEESDDTEAAE
jgi:multidrug efflux pump subunit AcrA (membrane-fusion protein)